MGFSINIPKAQECATVIRQASADLEAQAAELERIAHEVGMDADDILTQKGYEDRLKAAAGYLRQRRDSLERIAATLDKTVELVTDQEKHIISFIDKMSTSK